MYSPDEDSYFLSEILTKYLTKLKNKDIKILDTGSGSGVQAKICIKSRISPENITLSDIDSESLNYLKSNFKKSKIIKSNLFENIKEKFDLIIFNPPYLPADKYDNKKDTTGGKLGSETINKFLNQARDHLASKGKILLLTSSYSGKINWQDYKKKLLAKKKLFFEELCVWLLTSS
ncbi:MAG: HemK2/MTQ2 family protein methyltransferase [archaeon]